MPLDLRNTERLVAYQQKLRAWRDEHPEEYYDRLRRGLAVRWTWHRLWERKAREARQQSAAPVLRLVSVHPSFGTGA